MSGATSRSRHVLKLSSLLVHVATVRRDRIRGPLKMPRRANDWIGRLFDGCLVIVLTAASALVILYAFRGIL